MKNKYFYTAVFHREDEGGFWVSFPDFPESFTQGGTVEETYEMAIDALGLSLEEYLEENEAPTPTDITKINYEQNSFPVLIEFDMLAYRRKHGRKAVKKTLSIPSWLNEEAVAKGINFSQLLQNALKVELGL